MTKIHLVKAMVFPVVMYVSFDHKGWAPKNSCFQTVVLEKTVESLLDYKEIKSVNPKGNQPWIFIGRTDAEAEANLAIWYKKLTLEKTLTLGKIESMKRKGWQSMRWLDIITDSMDMNLSKLQETVKEKGA